MKVSLQTIPMDKNDVNLVLFIYPSENKASGVFLSEYELLSEQELELPVTQLGKDHSFRLLITVEK